MSGFFDVSFGKADSVASPPNEAIIWTETRCNLTNYLKTLVGGLAGISHSADWCSYRQFTAPL